MANRRDPAPVNLLSLDGGGVRGMSELVMVHRLMETMKELDPDQYPVMPKPCDVFHIIAGVSTGGLVAILLGRLRMSTEEAIAAYDDFAKEIFGHMDISMRKRYNAKKLQDIIEKIVKERQVGEQMLDPKEPEMGRVFVCATPTANLEAPLRMRTYESPDEEGLEGVKIWQAARATSAAPTFFEPMLVRGELLMDAAIGCNNPTDELLQEAGDVFDNSRLLGCLVSLGTGTRKWTFEEAKAPGESLWIKGRWRWVKGLVASLKNSATDTSQEHARMDRHFRHFKSTYFRFNVPEAADKVKLQEYKKLGILKADTLQYLDSEDEQIKKLAEVLCTRSSEGLKLEKACYLTQEPINKAQILDRPSWAFTGRDAILSKMNRAFDQRFSSPGGHRREFLLWGMGGVGKSQIALQFRAIHDSEYEHAQWIDATDSTTIEGSYLRFASKLGIEVANDGGAKVMEQVHQVLYRSSRNWLLIMDNCGAVEDLRPYLPHADAGHTEGHVIYTSRQNLLGQKLPPAQVAEVTVMDEEEAVGLLVMSAQLPSESPPCRAIVRAVGCLPLAIDQAGAYIRMDGCPPDQYVADFEKKKQEWLSDPLYEGSTEQNKAVYATFEMSWDALRALAREKKSRRRSVQARNAQALLSVACFYYHENFHPNMVERAASRRHHPDAWPLTWLRAYCPDTSPISFQGASFEDFIQLDKDGTTWNASPLRDAVALLKSFSLVTRTDQGGFSMHVLVHSWARDRIREENRQAYALCARKLLCFSIPNGPTDEVTTDLRLMAPHIKACWEHVTTPFENIWLEVEMQYKFGSAFRDMKLWRRAVGSSQAVLDLWKRQPEPYDEDWHYVIEAKKHLATTYEKMESWADAERLHEEIIASQARVLGLMNGETVYQHAHLAEVILQQHKWTEGTKLLRKLEDWLYSGKVYRYCKPEQQQGCIQAHNNWISWVSVRLEQVAIQMEYQQTGLHQPRDEYDERDARCRQHQANWTELFPEYDAGRHGRILQEELCESFQKLLDERDFDTAENVLGKDMHECYATHGIFSREMLTQLELLDKLYAKNNLYLEQLACTRVGIVVERMVRHNAGDLMKRNMWLGTQGRAYCNLGFLDKALQIQKAVAEYFSGDPEIRYLVDLGRDLVEGVEIHIRAVSGSRNPQRTMEMDMEQAQERSRARLEHLGENWVVLHERWFSDEIVHEFENIDPEEWRWSQIHSGPQPPKLFRDT